MNKYQEAYGKLTNKEYKYASMKSVYEDLEMLKPLVEKATPKKPILKAMEGYSAEVASHLVCPSCGKPIVNVWSSAEYKPRYCHYCGQALDWSE